MKKNISISYVYFKNAHVEKKIYYNYYADIYFI